MGFLFVSGGYRWTSQDDQHNKGLIQAALLSVQAELSAFRPFYEAAGGNGDVLTFNMLVEQAVGDVGAVRATLVRLPFLVDLGVTVLAPAWAECLMARATLLEY